MILAGVNGWNTLFGELGIAYYSKESKAKSDNASVYMYLGSEFRLKDFSIIGPKIGMFVHGAKPFGLGGGMSMIYYIGQGSGSLVGRPELGFHFHTFKLSYGYNHVFTNSAFSAVSHSTISAVFGLKLGKGKESSRVKKENKSF
jgi:hypothetical protein